MPLGKAPSDLLPSYLSDIATAVAALRDAWGITPLHIAAYRGFPALAALLLSPLPLAPPPSAMGPSASALADAASALGLARFVSHLHLAHSATRSPPNLIGVRFSSTATEGSCGTPHAMCLNNGACFLSYLTTLSSFASLKAVNSPDNSIWLLPDGRLTSAISDGCRRRSCCPCAGRPRRDGALAPRSRSSPEWQRSAFAA